MRSCAEFLARRDKCGERARSRRRMYYDEEMARAPRQHADQPGLSRFLIYPPSSRLPRRLSVQAATVFTVRRFAMTRVTQSPRLALRQSRVSRTPSTLLFSFLAELYRSDEMEVRWRREGGGGGVAKRVYIETTCVTHTHVASHTDQDRRSVYVHDGTRFDNRPVATSPVSLQLLIQFPPRTRHSYTTRLRDLRYTKRDCHTRGWMNFCE